MAIAVREGIRITGRLDYAAKELRLGVGSRVEVMRLNACAKEPETIAWIERSLQPDDVFYDIGANVGAYSFVAAARLEGKGCVYAFEASFATFASLSENVFLNHLQGRVIPIHVALSAETAILSLCHRDTRAGAAEHVLLPRSAEESARGIECSQPVLGYRLDDFVTQFAIAPPTLLKLDVDGVEPAVLAGAPNILRAPALRSVLVEIDDRQPSGESVRAALAAAGFVCESRHPKSWNERVANCVFTRGRAA